MLVQCPMHSPSGFVHLTHQNLSARALFCLNSLAKVNTQLLIYKKSRGLVFVHSTACLHAIDKKKNGYRYLTQNTKLLPHVIKMMQAYIATYDDQYYWSRAQVTESVNVSPHCLAWLHVLTMIKLVRSGKNAKFPRNMGQISKRKAKFPIISYVYIIFVYPVKQNFPPNDNISREWGSSVPHFFQAWSWLGLLVCY